MHHEQRARDAVDLVDRRDALEERAVALERAVLGLAQRAPVGARALEERHEVHDADDVHGRRPQLGVLGDRGHRHVAAVAAAHDGDRDARRRRRARARALRGRGPSRVAARRRRGGGSRARSPSSRARSARRRRCRASTRYCDDGVQRAAVLRLGAAVHEAHASAGPASPYRR